ncbi:MAG: RHS repeat-associated core domain-containing protein, partial [Erysipelotrichaceae bacterium]|nr:RHS repeat-associated core domain-containing protein [Erysipelotrichaceae bacterium]
QRTTLQSSVYTMIFLYHDDYLYGFEYNQTKYFYLRDSLGNINGIIDSTGKLVVEYVYNAFGKIIDILGEMKDTIGVINPFRYKGYYYDVETNLFLVTSRYYSPELGRFIQPADVSSLNPSNINGLNLYAYANNNLIGIAYSSSSVGVSVANQLINQNFSLLIVPNLGINKNNYSSSVHWKNEWFATDWPSFLVFSKTKGALLDWGLSIYKGSLYFDEAENHSIYIGVGNISAFVGYNVEEDKYGVFADANVLSVGYDGRYIDVGISVVGVGFILGWEDKKFRFKIDPPGWFGFDISIDFGQIIKDIFGWEW